MISVSFVLGNFKELHSDSLLNDSKILYSRPHIQEVSQLLRKFTKVIKKRKRNFQKKREYSNSIFSPHTHTSPDSSNTKDGCKTPGAKAGISSGVCSLPLMFNSQNHNVNSIN